MVHINGADAVTITYLAMATSTTTLRVQLVLSGTIKSDVAITRLHQLALSVPQRLQQPQLWTFVPVDLVRTAALVLLTEMVTRVHVRMVILAPTASQLLTTV